MRGFARNSNVPVLVNRLISKEEKKLWRLNW